MEEHLRWDLTELYPGPSSPELEGDLQKAQDLAREFEDRYRGKINQPGLPPELLGEALGVLEEIERLIMKADTYVGLLFSLDTQSEVAKALQAKIEEVRVFLDNRVLFFELEWRKLSAERAEGLISHPKLSPWRHFLERQRLLIPHTLSEEEERILNEKSLVASAWASHFGKIAGKIEVGGAPLARVLAELESVERDQRKHAQEAITEVLKKEAFYLVDIFNALILDHSIDVRLKKYPDPMAQRNLTNEVSGEAVEALLSTCDENTGIVARYYALKKKLLGLEELFDYDRYAPISQKEGASVGLGQARELIGSSYTDYSSQIGQIVERFFKESWIDTPVTKGKRTGAFAASLPFLHPFILTNWTGKRRDVLMLAHELGHGVHFVLSQDVSLLQNHTTLTLAETASVFGEQLVFERLLGETPDPEERLGLLCGMLDSSFATVFRQSAFTRFEQKLHKGRSQGELSLGQINNFWLETQNAMFKGAVTLTENYAWWWVYVPHFIYTPFYCYAYAFGKLLTLALYGKYLKEGKEFVSKYVELLSAGGSESPSNLLKKVGVEIEDPNFWREGIEVLRTMVEEAESLAEEISARK